VTSLSAPRDDATWYTPAGLPNEVTSFGDSVQDTLALGTAGKVGLLDLAVAPHGGVTRVERQYQQMPLHVYRPIYLDERRPDMAFLFVQHFGDGFVQGDRYRIDIDCAAGSATHITTQAATNVFRARDNFATQLVNLRVGAGAVLEYLPDPIVPFRGSRLFQRICVTVDPEATVILGETLLPGRVARGEAHAYDIYWAETEARRPDGTLLFADVLRLTSRDGETPRSSGLLGAHDVLATLYVMSPGARHEDLVELLRSSLALKPDVTAGVTELPNDSGVVVKLLGPSSKTVNAALTTAWSAARLELLGTPAPHLRKG
jgi:urease accessory protein